MAQFTFTHEEVATLIEVLQSEQSELRMEIANTDRMEFRDHLKETKGVIQGVINQLQKSLQETPQEVTQEEVFKQSAKG